MKIKERYYDYIIVGAGLTGCVLAERLAVKGGKKILLVEQRNHIAGNCYDYYDQNGVFLHKYGPHAFHTNDEKIFTYLSNFTKWHFYQHRVLAYVCGKLIPLPVNIETLEMLYGLKLTSEQMMDEYLQKVRFDIAVPNNAEEQVTSQLGYDLYQKIFKGYTEKQWGIAANKLDATVTKRIPVRYNRDCRYFTDKYQIMPKFGYTKMMEKMIANEKIAVLLQTDYKKIKGMKLGEKLIFTGPIDEYFNYRFGKLPYRSLDFEFVYKNDDFFQKVAQVNYPNDYDFTRITEYKHMTGQKCYGTTLSYEYPKDGTNINEKYYPMPTKEAEEIYKKYQRQVKEENVFFCGRLAEYKYYNMDQVIKKALLLSEELLAVDY